MNVTIVPNSNYRTKKWLIIDANERALGRIATNISNILQGKHKSDYYPSRDMGDYIIVINAEKMIYDISKIKYHVYSPGRPGRSLKKLTNITPQKRLERSVRNMLPKSLRSIIPKRLRIYNSSTHPHLAQKPTILEL